uniref:DDE_3 domain-containing protein n=1 Tax=Heterorhabditis bacteriophora TaxID=37862 RepID=A0A1I7WLH8_HETBA
MLQRAVPSTTWTCGECSNAGPHVAILTREKICALRWKTLPHRPYSPHIPPSDYQLFLAFDNHMRNKRFHKEAEIETEERL